MMPIFMLPKHGTFKGKKPPRVRTRVVDPRAGIFEVEVTTFPSGLARLWSNPRTWTARVRQGIGVNGEPVFMLVGGKGVIGPADLGYFELFCRANGGARARD